MFEYICKCCGFVQGAYKKGQYYRCPNCTRKVVRRPIAGKNYYLGSSVLVRCVNLEDENAIVEYLEPSKGFQQFDLRRVGFNNLRPIKRERDNQWSMRQS